MEYQMSSVEKPIVLRGSYGWKDMLKAHRLHEGFAESFLLPPLLLLFFIPPILQQPEARSSTNLDQLILSAAIITISSIILVSIFHFLLLPMSIRRNFQKETESRFEFQFDQDGIEFVREFAQIKQPWELITHFRENGDLILLYSKGRNYVAVPKWAMENGDEERIKGLLQHYAKRNRNFFGAINYRILLFVFLISLFVILQLFLPGING